MEHKTCFIAGAGDFCGEYLPQTGDYVIAADAGYTFLTERGITPDLVVGDFDSLGVVPEHPNIIRHPAFKDDTDMMLAVKEGLSAGCRTFVINGGLGGKRFDHTLANIQTLAYISRRGSRGYLVGDGITMTAVTDGLLTFNENAEGFISVFCAGDRAEGVFLRGLKYPLTNATLTCDVPLGVSNEFTGASTSVSVKSGTLIVTWAGGLDKAAVL